MRNRIYHLKAILLATFLLFFSLIATPLFAKVLYGEGKAYIFGNHKSKAKKQALSTAKRDVLLQDLKSIIGAKKVKDNFSLLQKIIFSNPDYYLLKVKILQSSTKNGSYLLKLKAETDRNRIKPELLRNQIIFTEEDKKKIFLLYLPKNNASYDITNQKTKSFLTAISKQESIFSLKHNLNLNTKLLNSDISTIKKRLKTLGFDGVVIVDLYPLPDLEEGFVFQQSSINSSIVLSELDVKDIASNEVSFPIYTNSKKDSADYKKILDFSLMQLADILSSYVEDLLGDYYTIRDPKRFTLEFHKFNLLELRKIEIHNSLKNPARLLRIASFLPNFRQRKKDFLLLL